MEEADVFFDDPVLVVAAVEEDAADGAAGGGVFLFGVEGGGTAAEETSEDYEPVAGLEPDSVLGVEFGVFGEVAYGYLVSAYLGGIDDGVAPAYGAALAVAPCEVADLAVETCEVGDAGSEEEQPGYDGTGFEDFPASDLSGYLFHGIVGLGKADVAVGEAFAHHVVVDTRTELHHVPVERVVG